MYAIRAINPNLYTNRLLADNTYDRAAGQQVHIIRTYETQQAAQNAADELKWKNPLGAWTYTVETFTRDGDATAEVTALIEQAYHLWINDYNEYQAAARAEQALPIAYREPNAVMYAQNTYTLAWENLRKIATIDQINALAVADGAVNN